MAQKLNVYGGTKSGESVAEFAVNHSVIDPMLQYTPSLYMKYQRNGDAHTGYITFKARDSIQAAAMGVSGENAFFDVVKPNATSGVLEKVKYLMASGEAISRSVVDAPIPKNMSCDAIKVIYYSPISGELTIAGAMN